MSRPPLLLAAGLMLAFALAARAQTGATAATSASTVQSLPAYEGQNVSSIELAGWPQLDAAPLLALLPQQTGHPFSRALVDQSIGVLKARLAARALPGVQPPGVQLQGVQLQGVQLQGVQLQGVQLDVRPETTGLRILFILEPASYFGVYAFPGAATFSYTRLLQAANYLSQEPFTFADVHRGQTGLQTYFQQEGYFLAEVQPQLRPNLTLGADHGLVSVVFGTHLGPKARFGNVILDGATPAENAQLQAAIGSFWARLHRAAIRSGATYSHSTLTNAAQYLQSQLTGAHHLAAQVRLQGARYVRATNQAEVSFQVQPGPIVQLQVTGAHLWPWTRHNLLPIYQEGRVDAETIQEGQQNLANYFSSNGYFLARVTTTVEANGSIHTSQQAAEAPAPPLLTASTAPATAREAIVYSIAKGPRHSVLPVRFRGNRSFSDSRLAAVVTIHAGGFLSHGAFSQPLLRASASNLAALYQGAGFSSVRVTPSTAFPGGNAAVTFTIVEGVQDHVAALHLQGNTLPLSVLAPHGLKTAVGDPYSQNFVAQDRAGILAQYLSLGYLNASLRATARQLAGHPHQIAVTYTILEGPQVHTAAVATLGRLHTQPELIARDTSSILPGALLTEDDLLTAESRLYTPGIFDWAEVAPRTPITNQTDADVTVKLHEAPRNSLIYGFGFDYTNRGGSIPSGTVALPGLPIVGLPSNFITSEAAFYGPDGDVEYTRLNLFGKADTFNAGAFAGRLDQHGSLTFSDPNLFWSNFTGDLQFSAEHNSENPIFTSDLVELSYQLDRALNREKNIHLFLRYSLSQTDLTRLLIPALVPAEDLNVRLSTMSATYIRDTRDNPLDAHHGILESLELDDNSRALGSSVDFGKMIAQTAYYHEIWNKTVWANSLRVGAARAFGGSFVPLSQAFFSGGGSTLRGFPLDGAGPQSTIPACGNPAVASTCGLIQVPDGGNALLIVNTELRIPTPDIYKNLGVALFYDGGNVFSHVGFSHLGAPYTNTVGAGLRYETPIGPVRIDLGHLVNPLPGIKSTQVFVTLGQAF